MDLRLTVRSQKHVRLRTYLHSLADVIITQQLIGQLLAVSFDDIHKRIDQERELLRLGACIAAFAVITDLRRLYAERRRDLKRRSLLDLKELGIGQFKIERL